MAKSYNGNRLVWYFFTVAVGLLVLGVAAGAQQLYTQHGRLTKVETQHDAVLHRLAGIDKKIDILLARKD